MLDKNAPYCTIGFQDTKLRLIGIPLLAMLMPIVFFDCNPFNSGWTYLKEFGMTLIHVTVYWHMDRGVVILFRKRYPYFQQYKKRVVLQAITIVIVTLVAQYFSYLLLGGDNWNQYLEGAVQPSQTKYFLATSFVSVMILAIYESMYAFDMWSMGVTQYERLKKENVQAQLDTLKNQVNPHFLFNSLNTLAALIPEDSDLAVKFVEKLSKVYRFVLEIKDKQFISLKEELKAIDSYTFLLKMRFGENINFTRNIKEQDEQLLLIPLSIQMLIENAVKHNIISQTKPLHIKIHIENDFVVIENNLQLKKQIQSSTKTGLMNIQKRYALLSNKAPIFISNEASFIVKLPLISIKQTTS